MIVGFVGFAGSDHVNDCDRLSHPLALAGPCRGRARVVPLRPWCWPIPARGGFVLPDCTMPTQPFPLFPGTDAERWRRSASVAVGPPDTPTPRPAPTGARLMSIPLAHKAAIFSNFWERGPTPAGMR